jgi:hypothetical protein
MAGPALERQARFLMLQHGVMVMEGPQKKSPAMRRLMVPGSKHSRNSALLQFRDNLDWVNDQGETSCELQLKVGKF